MIVQPVSGSTRMTLIVALTAVETLRNPKP